MLRTIGRVGTMLALAVGLVGGTGATAQAAVVNPVTPQSLCGHHDRANPAIGGIGTCF